MPPLLETATFQDDTALHLCLRKGEPSLVSILIEKGADLSLVNILEETPMGMLWDSYRQYTLVMEKNLQDVSSTETIYVKNRQGYKKLFDSMQEKLDGFHAETYSSVRNEILQLYEEHCPDRIHKLDSQMKQFDGKEMQLLKRIREKYN